ncbi:hypothetical protein OSB04_005163 [Centaurea solstitialis]|uniref:Uncharacterized protein n=1 Tax=Centaurea solstitialis TaxID=347529 RepID=A0AA38U050_9ASTR|nr:hypothetical protein OSB04_005163 [Centaurea solstitialis]
MEAIGGRLRLLLRPLTSSPSSRIQLQARNLFSSSPANQAAGIGHYPKTIRRTSHRKSRLPARSQNTASVHNPMAEGAEKFGKVDYPVKTFTTRDGKIGAYTQLRVEFPSDSKRIFLNMFEDMAELSIQHLKPNDCIYVSGYLGAFTKACDNGNIILRHKLIVKEINYVATNNQTTSKNIEDPQESPLEKHRKRLHLWQVFFASPHEWKDLRKRKTNPRQPDFKHKGTGEALWLKSSDPPWVMRQLQLQDSRMGGMYLGEHPSYRSSLSPMSYESD